MIEQKEKSEKQQENAKNSNFESAIKNSEFEGKQIQKQMESLQTR